MSDGSATPISVAAKNTQKAPERIAKYAQAALLLFAVASVIAGWSGNKLATLVLTAVIVIGFMIALLGFERLARASGGYYAKLAIFLTTMVLVAISALFITVLVYIGTGYPVALDRIFGYQTPAAPVAAIEGRDRNSIALRLTPYPNPDAEIEVGVFDRNGKVVRSSERISPLLDHFAVYDLEPAKRYLVRVTAIVRSRPSEPKDLVAVTDAARMPVRLPIHEGVMVDAAYSGSLTDELVPEADFGRFEFEFVQDDVVWRYEGPVHGGLPEGKGVMTRHSLSGGPCDPLALDRLQICRPECRSVEFEKGTLLRGDCSLLLNDASWREKDKLFVTDGAATYTGSVAGINRIGGQRIGPYPILFEGDGVLRGDHVRLAGTWRRGALEGQGLMEQSNGLSKSGLFEGGLLKEGQVLGEPYFGSPDETASYEVREFAPHGASAILRKNGFSFGVMSGSNPRGPYDIGYQGDFRDGKFVLTRFENGNIWRTEYRPLTRSESGDCQYHETFGMDVDTSAMFAKGWHIHTINHILDPGETESDAPDYEISLELAPADVHVKAFRNREQTADIRFWIGNNFAKKQEIEIDGQKIETNTIYATKQRQAALTLAKMCSAKKVKNLTNGNSTDIAGFCPVVALIIGRAYYCAPKPVPASDSAWYVERDIGNWHITVRNKGNNPKALAPVEGRAVLKTLTAGLDYNIILSCRLPNTKVFGLALWGPNRTGNSPGDSTDFTFTANGAERTLTLPMPRGGVFEVPSSIQQQVFDLLKSTEKLIVSFRSYTDETVSFEFAPDGWAKALEAVHSTCPS